MTFRTVFQRGALILGGAAAVLFATASLTTAQTITNDQKQAVIRLAATKLGLSDDQLTDALKQARKDLGVNQGRPRARDLIAGELAVAARTIGVDVRTLRQMLPYG